MIRNMLQKIIEGKDLILKEAAHVINDNVNIKILWR